MKQWTKTFFDFPLLGHFEEGEEVVDVRVHAAVAEEADEMELALAAVLHGLLEERDLVELLVGDEEIDAGDVHVYDAAGADVEMADFTVAHLTFGKADGGAGGLDQGVGELRRVRRKWFAREGDGVALGFGAEAPAIEDGEYERFRSFSHERFIVSSSNLWAIYVSR